MPDFKAKMHQIRFPLVLPQSLLEELIVLPRLLAVLEADLLLRGKGGGKGRNGKDEGRGREEERNWKEE